MNTTVSIATNDSVFPDYQHILNLEWAFAYLHGTGIMCPEIQYEKIGVYSIWRISPVDDDKAEELKKIFDGRGMEVLIHKENKND